MAGSGFPPLTNIPYCCLPQESGPCLSTSVGDRPLRSPTHRRLGGPSPRLPSNGTHARPRPPLGFIPRRMPSRGTMAYYPAFPPAIRLSGVGCIRVAHPCATLMPPEGDNPVRLACIRPAASVHPEPGSNSSLYYCSYSNFSSESRVPPRCPSQGLAPGGSFPRGASRPPRSSIVLASDFQRTFRSRFPSLRPLFRSESGCKSTAFYITRNILLKIFFLVCLCCCVSDR